MLVQIKKYIRKQWNEQLAKFKRMRNLRFEKFKKQREREIRKLNKERKLRQRQFDSELKAMTERQSAAESELTRATMSVKRLEQRCEELMMAVQTFSAPIGSDREKGAGYGVGKRNLKQDSAKSPSLSYPSTTDVRFVPAQSAPQYVLSVLPPGNFSAEYLTHPNLGFQNPSLPLSTNANPSFGRRFEKRTAPTSGTKKKMKHPKSTAENRTMKKGLRHSVI
jgi:hypothetical protein